VILNCNCSLTFPVHRMAHLKSLPGHQQIGGTPIIWALFWVEISCFVSKISISGLNCCH
jgi:hypothetical protein